MASNTPNTPKKKNEPIKPNTSTGTQQSTTSNSSIIPDIVGGIWGEEAKKKIADKFTSTQEPEKPKYPPIPKGNRYTAYFKVKISEQAAAPQNNNPDPKLKAAELKPGIASKELTKTIDSLFSATSSQEIQGISFGLSEGLNNPNNKTSLGSVFGTGITKFSTQNIIGANSAWYESINTSNPNQSNPTNQSTTQPSSATANNSSSEKKKEKKEKALNTIANNNTALNSEKKKKEEDVLVKLLSEVWGAENIKTQSKNIFDLLKDMWGDAQSQQSEAQKGKTWIFSSLDGSIIGNPSVSLNTYKHSIAKFIIYDPNDSIRKELINYKKVEVTIGYTDSSEQNIFMGEIYTIGRKLPDGCEIVAVDNSFKMQNTGSSVQYNQSIPAGQQTPEYKVAKTLTGDATIYPKPSTKQKTASGEELDITKLTIAHKDLPFKTQVRIINPKTNKNVIATVNDRGPKETGKIISITQAIADQIGLEKTGGAVKIEVLEEVKKPATPTASNGQATNTTGQTTTQPNNNSSTPANNTNTSSNNQPATPNPPSGNPASFTNLIQQSAEASNNAANNQQQAPLASALNQQTGTNLNFVNNSNNQTGSLGTIQTQQSAIGAASNQANNRGDAIVTRGNTMTQVSPGKGEPSGLILHYKSNPNAFIGSPIARKRTNIQLQSGFGALTVKGWNVNNKQTVGATVVTPGPNPAGVASVNVPEWGTLKMTDPIFPGCVYTWGDATKDGTRPPENKEIMAGIIKIAQAIMPLTEKTVGKGNKWMITSWYRDPVSNANADGRPNSRHLRGDAVDFWFEENGGCFALHDSLDPTWPGGLAKKPGQFVHLDCRDTGQARWDYTSG